MVQGKIQWTNHIKGYGFIISDEKSVFFHHSDTENFHSLSDNDIVELEIVPGEKGLKAKNVKKKGI